MAVLSTSANIATPGLPVGSIQAFAGANAPTGWLLCDGSAVSRGNYPDLFNTIGTTYGSGNGATTFNLPDLRGRVPAGKDDMGGTAASRLTSAVSGVSGTALGGSGGSQNIPDHSHQSYIRLFEYYNDAILGQSGASGAGGYNARTGAWTTWQHPTTTIGGITVNDYTGRSTPASTWVSQTNMISEGPSYQQTPQNVQPTLVVNYIIKAVADIARGGWYTQSSPPVVTQLPTNPAIGEEVYLYQSGYIYHQRYDGTNWQKTNNDIIVCTSSTRPASPPTGQQIFETNTGFVYMYNGASWLQMRQTNDSVDISLLPSGSVIQAVQRISSTYQYVFNNFLYTECYCYITPLISTSKILVMASASIWTTSSSDGGFGGGIYSNIGGQLIQVSRIGHGFDETGDEANNSGFTYLRSGHNTTSSHYYQFTADPYRNNSGTGVYCNRSFQQTDYSVMTLLEIK